MNGNCRPIIAPSAVAGRPVTAPSTVTGDAERAERHRRGVEDQHEDQRLQRRKADQDQQRAGDRDRRAESRDALQQRAEAEADHDQHDAPVIRQMLDHPGAERVEPPGSTAIL